MDQSDPALGVVALAPRAPKQQRSRKSFERVVATTAAVISERGRADFTLAEISRRARVSIGSIYGRVSGKEELVRVVQEHVYQQTEREFAALEARLMRRPGGLAKRLPAAIDEFAQYLQRHASFMHAMIDLSATDPLIAARGKRSFHDTEARFMALLLDCRGEIHHRDPAHAAAFCHRVVYDMVCSHLGINQRTQVNDGRWEQLLEDLHTLVRGYLLPKRG